ncbi:MAG: hypothetical protein ACOC44_05330 [Promethearchaeia archaeon]
MPKDKVNLSFEIGKYKNRLIEGGITRSFSKERCFKNIIEDILEFYHEKENFKKIIDWDKIEVFVNRPPENSHPEPKANMDRYCPLARKVRIPTHKKLDESDLNLSLEKLLQKSKIGVFTIYY